MRLEKNIDERTQIKLELWRTFRKDLNQLEEKYKCLKKDAITEKEYPYLESEFKQILYVILHAQELRRNHIRFLLKTWKVVSWSEEE